MERRSFLALPFGTWAITSPDSMTEEERIFSQYVDAVVEYCQTCWGERFDANTLKGYPDESLMRGIEEKVGIPEQGADDFRRHLLAHFGSLAWNNKPITWESNTLLAQAVRLTVG